MELCTICWESLILMGVIVMLSLSREMKETRSILSHKRRPCCGIKEWGILEKRAFEHYMVNVWLIESVPSYHMTPHREWLSEYEKYDGGDVFLGDDSTTKILGRGRVKLLLNDGRIRTLPRVKS